MSSNKKYYWLKLNEKFFDEDTILWLEEQENGKDYVIFYLKLCLKSLQDDGKLIRYVGEKLIPYDIKALGNLTNTPVDTVAVAMKTFIEIGLVERLDTGEIYLTQINELIGSETEVAKRVRKHRAKQTLIEQQSEGLLQSNNAVTKSNTEIDIEIEKEIELEREKKKNNSRNSSKLKYDDDSPYMILANHLFEEIRLNNAGAKKPNFQTWADDMRKLVELDKRDIEEVKEIIKWCQKDSFWKGNILSAKKLREQYDQLKVKSGKTKRKRDSNYDTSEYDDLY